MNKSDCKIAVIGGGISGLVIAEGLQKKGYKNVTVFEKEERLGGKLHTIWYNGRSYELGAIFGLPSQSNLKSLMKRLNIKADGPKLSRINYDANGKKIMPIPKTELGDFVDELDRLPNILAMYKSLENASIQNIEPSLMLPFSKWCDIHQFRILKTVYVQYFTIFGLGNIDEVPALYVLRILNYDHLMSFMEFPQFSTWEYGVSSLIECLKQEIKDIRLGQKVVDISLSQQGTLWVQTQFEVLEFNQVVITAPLDEFSDLHFWDQDMKRHLNSIKYQSFNVYAFIGDKIPKGCGCVLENLSPNRQGHIMICDSRWEVWDGEGMAIIYAYNSPDNSKMSSLDLIKDDLLKLGVQNPRLYQAKNWRHCPYVDTFALESGFYEKMESMQGKNNVFLAGEIMSTLSIENCIWYSQDLLNRFF
ncbi:FAD-dependent oxidoreductase [Tissierella sp. MSJ-40]|uniref:FAD-dependent oxidoreductase n=1 Tax=Tissierella simiarum TaxID=2841534 RepID=A0ABS6E6N3_9FIRM|nr:FAD-dependent oxidoreductase [Tissierella simiarum]MBU5438424.1 FAD-dependent oxidoreductase [Tissierella simiarum]